MASDNARANFLLLASQVPDAKLAEATVLLCKLVCPPAGPLVSSDIFGCRDRYSVLPPGILLEVVQWIGCGTLWRALVSVSRALEYAVVSSGMQRRVVIHKAEDLLAFAYRASKSMRTCRTRVSIKLSKSWTGKPKSVSNLPVCRSVVCLSLDCAQGFWGAHRLRVLWHIFPKVSALELRDIKNLNVGRVSEFSHLPLLELSATNCTSEACDITNHYALKLNGTELPTTLQKLRLVNVDLNWEQQGLLLKQMDLRQIHIKLNCEKNCVFPQWMGAAALQLVQNLSNLVSFHMGDLSAADQAAIAQVLRNRGM